MRKLLAVVVVAASCALPPVELVDSLGDGGEAGSTSGGGGDAGTSSGGKSGGSSGSSAVVAGEDAGGSANPGLGGESGSGIAGGPDAPGGSPGSAGAPGAGGEGGEPSLSDCPATQPGDSTSCSAMGASCDYGITRCDCDQVWDCGGNWSACNNTQGCPNRPPLVDSPCSLQASFECNYCPHDGCEGVIFECAGGRWTTGGSIEVPEEGSSCLGASQRCTGSDVQCECNASAWSCGSCPELGIQDGDSCDSNESDISCVYATYTCVCLNSDEWNCIPS
jgi:hypothetical protein